MIQRLKNNQPPFTRNRAFSLVEVTVSLGIASFCFLALFGLLPVGLSSNQTSVEQTMAGGVATTVASDLRAAGAEAQASPGLQIPLPKAGVSSATQSNYFFVRDDGTPLGAVNADFTAKGIADMSPRYRVTVDTTTAPNNAAVLWSRIRVSWPPMISLASTSTAKPSGVVEVMTSLNRRP